MAEGIILRTPSKHVAVHKTGSVNRFKAQRLQYVPPGLTFTNATFCPHSVFVLCGSQNKQRLFPYTALTDWFL
jgi:hypothetical protein